MPGEVEIETWDVEGKGTTRLDLTNPIPTTKGRVDMHQTMASPTDDTTLDQEAVMKIRLTPNN
jgi:hypothetical protein